jgi:hypothetical protein
MSTPFSDDQPTTVQRHTAEQPTVTAAAATRRTRLWERKVPARLGRARTSTVVIGALFVLLFGLNSTLPQDTYTTVQLPNGDSVRVRSSQISTAPAAPSTTPPATTSETPAAPSSSTPTSQAPPTTSGQQTGTTPPRTTNAPQETTRTSTTPPATTSRAPATTTPAPTTSVAPGSVAPGSVAPESVAPTP